MYTSALRPKQIDKTPSEQHICPVCSSEHINEYSVAPYTYSNLTVQVRECANQHSWERTPGSISAITSNPVDHPHSVSGDAEPFQNVVRPFQDSKELYKRF